MIMQTLGISYFQYSRNFQVTLVRRFLLGNLENYHRLCLQCESPTAYDTCYKLAHSRTISGLVVYSDIGYLQLWVVRRLLERHFSFRLGGRPAVRYYRLLHALLCEHHTKCEPCHATQLERRLSWFMRERSPKFYFDEVLGVRVANLQGQWFVHRSSLVRKHLFDGHEILFNQSRCQDRMR